MQTPPPMSTTRQPLVTAEDLATSHYADRHVELVDGRVIEMSAAFSNHGGLAAHIHQALAVWNHTHRVGVVLSAETGFVLKRSPDTLRAPDVAFVRNDRWLAADKFFEGAPDVAIEVLSGGDRASQVSRKIRDYLRAGAQQVWIVDPQARTLDVHTQAGDVTLSGQDVLDGGDALPGFRLELAALFAP